MRVAEGHGRDKYRTYGRIEGVLEPCIHAVLGWERHATYDYVAQALFCISDNQLFLIFADAELRGGWLHWLGVGRNGLADARRRTSEIGRGRCPTSDSTLTCNRYVVYTLYILVRKMLQKVGCLHTRITPTRMNCPRSVSTERRGPNAWTVRTTG